MPPEAATYGIIGRPAMPLLQDFVEKIIELMLIDMLFLYDFVQFSPSHGLNLTLCSAPKA